MQQQLQHPIVMQQYQQQSQPWSTAPAAVDLLDRLALLRRVAPTTHPSPRPLLLQRHAAAVEHTASPRRAAGPGTAGASRLGAGPGGRDVTAVESPRPLPVTVVPAPGWQYLGEVEVSWEDCYYGRRGLLSIKMGSCRQHQPCSLWHTTEQWGAVYCSLNGPLYSWASR